VTASTGKAADKGGCCPAITAAMASAYQREG